MNEEVTFPIRGRCTCGEVGFQITTRAMFVHCCHCRWCQRETGSAFVVNAMIESDRVEVLAGQVDRVRTPTASGKGQYIVRCPRCRIALWSYYAGLGEKVAFVRVGTLEEPDLLPPDIHIYTASKQPWLELPKDTPAVAEFYRRSEYWPQDSIRRRRVLLEP